MANYGRTRVTCLDAGPGKTKAFLLSVLNQVTGIGIVIIIILFVGILRSKI